MISRVATFENQTITTVRRVALGRRFVPVECVPWTRRCPAIDKAARLGQGV